MTTTSTSTSPQRTSSVTQGQPLAPGSDADSPVLTLESLAAMTVEELTATYKAGWVPDNMAAVDGAPRCRMLTPVGGAGRGRIGRTIRNMAASGQFPWAGKSFEAIDTTSGTGINRVRWFGGKEWFPFETSFINSAIDGKPCIFLEYDLPENPWFIRRIHDELREVSPGLFIGPAMIKSDAGPSLVLFFSIDHTGAYN